MAYVCGSIEKLSQCSVSWNLNCIMLPEICLSEKFTVFGDKYEFFFQLLPFDENSATLGLSQLKAVSLQINMHVNVYYFIGTKDFSLVNFGVTGIFNKLATIKTYGLRRITCNFSNIREINGLSDESGKQILFSGMAV